MYVKGKVKSIAVSNNIEQSYANTGPYGNASFYITDSDDATGEFYVFRALYLGNMAYQVGQTDIKVGDEVVICGALMNYHGNTPETVANEAYLYSLNGETSSVASDVFGVENAAISVGASATSATIKVTGNVAWTASSTDATVTPASGTGAGDVTVTFAANTDTENAKTYHVTLSTTADVAEKTINVVITQGKVNTSGGESVSLTFPDENSNSNKVGAYTDTWTAKIGAHTWSITAFNNNNWKDWTYIRCGRKNNDSVASISSDVFTYPINSVVVTYDKFASVNSTKLIVASDADFSKDVQEIAGSGEKAGNVTYSIPTPTADRYYKLVVDNKSASSNGSVQISKIVYSVD